MKYALIGKNISHSRSPFIYRKLISESLYYDLIDIDQSSHLPALQDLSKTYQGINITSPYKQHYLNDVIIEDSEVAELKAINTIALTSRGFFATNTDLLAVRSILQNLRHKHPGLHLIILGRGVMGRLTEIVAKGLMIPFKTLERKSGLSANSDLLALDDGTHPLLVINACSRDFVFEGNIPKSAFFWDYNYNFLPHQNTLPFRVSLYLDGQEMLWLQAKAAVKFWETTIAKLNP